MIDRFFCLAISRHATFLRHSVDVCFLEQLSGFFFNFLVWRYWLSSLEVGLPVNMHPVN